jgi:hypothetical protein
MGCPVKIAVFKARIEKTKREICRERTLRAKRARERRMAGALPTLGAIRSEYFGLEPERPPTPILRAKAGPFVGRAFVSAPPPPEATGAGVYLLRETGTNFVKIGWTSDFKRRYSSMRQTCNPRKLVFLGWLSRSDDEGLHHRECAAYSVGLDAGGTEWFEMPEDKIADLVAACTGVPK